MPVEGQQVQEAQRRRCFYDLGSGMGKPSVTAALTLPDYFEKCVGIELLEGLYNKSLELATAYSQSDWAQSR